jgi:hypothetical protein
MKTKVSDDLLRTLLFVFATFIIVLTIGILIGRSLQKTYNGMCYFEVYDDNLVGMRIKVYNFSYADSEGRMYANDCEGLRQMCLRQQNDTDRFLSTNIKCIWQAKYNTCECYPFESLLQ